MARRLEPAALSPRLHSELPNRAMALWLTDVARRLLPNWDQSKLTRIHEVEQQAGPGRIYF
jgi:hypothetical protein